MLTKTRVGGYGPRRDWDRFRILAAYDRQQSHHFAAGGDGCAQSLGYEKRFGFHSTVIKLWGKSNGNYVQKKKKKN